MTDKHVSRSRHTHAVRFYEDDGSLCRIVADFLAEGLVVGEPGIVIATPAHCDGIVKRLVERSLDVEELRRRHDVLFLDADETLAAFMVDGQPDSARFTAAMTHAIETACRGQKDRTIRAYGQMVDLLWKSSLHTAAIRLEMFWNQLANTHRFSLLCGYSMGHFYKDAAYNDICQQHTHILSADGEVGSINSSD